MSGDAPKSTLGTSNVRAKAKQLMRQELLMVARELLRTEGSQALSTRRVAQHLGTSTTAIYTLFGGKDGLTQALYTDSFARLEQELTDLPEHPDALEQVRALNRAYRDAAKRGSAEYDLMFGHAIPGFVPSPQAQAHAWQSLQPLVRAAQRAIREGQLPAQSAEALAMKLWVASHGLVSVELSGYFPDALEAQVMHEQIITDLLRAAGASA